MFFQYWNNAFQNAFLQVWTFCIILFVERTCAASRKITHGRCVLSIRCVTCAQKCISICQISIWFPSVYVTKRMWISVWTSLCINTCNASHGVWRNMPEAVHFESQTWAMIAWKIMHSRACPAPITEVASWVLTNYVSIHECHTHNFWHVPILHAGPVHHMCQKSLHASCFMGCS